MIWHLGPRTRQAIQNFPRFFALRDVAKTIAQTVNKQG
jgi:hypothetical protein